MSPLKHTIKVYENRFTPEQLKDSTLYNLFKNEDKLLRKHQNIQNKKIAAFLKSKGIKKRGNNYYKQGVKLDAHLTLLQILDHLGALPESMQKKLQNILQKVAAQKAPAEKMVNK